MCDERNRCTINQPPRYFYLDNPLNTEHSAEEQTYEKDCCLEAISLDKAYKIFDENKKNGFYGDKNTDVRYAIPDMEQIDAFAVAQKVTGFLTFNLEKPEKSKSQNTDPKQKWYGLQTAITMFRFLGVTNLNARNLFALITRHSVADNLYKVSISSRGFNSEFIIPISYTTHKKPEEIKEMVQNFVSRIDEKFDINPTECTFPKITLSKQQKHTLTKLPIEHLGDTKKDSYFYLYVIWFREFNGKIGKPDPHAHLVTALIYPQLRKPGLKE